MAPIAQPVEQLPFKEKVVGSNPTGRTKKADLAQLVEQLSCKQQVVGSSPTVGSELKKSPHRRFFIYQNTALTLNNNKNNDAIWGQEAEKL